MKTLLVVATIAALIQPASAQVTGNTWEADCASQERRTACVIYARGFADALGIWQTHSPSTALACIPHGVTSGQLVDVARKYLSEHPQDRHKTATTLLGTAFVLAWPCPKKSQDKFN
jgi:hypothetical protein